MTGHKKSHENKRYWVGIGFLVIIVGGIYFSVQAQTIYGGDAGDLASAIATFGVAHPPGYPLYTLVGILINKNLLYSTVAWRISLVSLISSLGVGLLLFDFVFLFTKSALISLLTSLIYAFLYPIWLYSITVEVFALFNLFLIAILNTAYRYFIIRKKIYLYLCIFLTGLSLSHHHIILFFFPSLFYLLYKSRVFGGKTLRMQGNALLLFLSGLTPYLYFPVSVSFHPAVNWMGTATLVNFIQLVTRAGYGTFRAGSFTQNHPVLRFFGIRAFFDFFIKDFRMLGIIMVILGGIYLYRKNRVLFTALCLGICSYLFFLFYASFPLTDNFLIGTYERFVHPLYLLLSILAGFGLCQLKEIITTNIERIMSPKKARVIGLISLFLFCIYPASLYYLHYKKIAPLRNDFTAERLGEDILTSIPKDAILILSTDTPLFDTQYIYYTQKKRMDVTLIHLTKLYTPYYLDQLKYQYPGLLLPDKTDSSKAIFQSLIDRNYDKKPIFSKLAFVSENGVWIPWGLLFRFYKTEDLPADTKIIDTNKNLFLQYQDPLSGSLSVFQNLLLSDVMRVYATGYQEFAFWAARRGYLNDAENHLISAKRLNPADPDSDVLLAQVFIAQKKCQKAHEILSGWNTKDEAYIPSKYYLQSLEAKVCFKDSEKAFYFEKLYEESKRGKETPLKKL